MRFWMVSSGVNFKEDLLWNLRLRSSGNLGAEELRYICGHLVHRGADLRVADWPSALRGRQAQRGDGEDTERKVVVMKVDKNKIDYPIDIPP